MASVKFVKVLCIFIVCVEFLAGGGDASQSLYMYSQ